MLDRFYVDPLFGDQWRAPSRIVAERFRPGTSSSPFTNEMLNQTLAELRASAALIGEIQFAQDRRDPIPVYPLVYLLMTGMVPLG